MNIYIANLSFRVQSDDLKQVFEEYGQVSSARVISDKFTGKSRGFGFVEMPNDEEAQNAIKALDQADYDGKVISVSVARPRTEKPGGENRGGRSFNNGPKRNYNSNRY
ncbi:MAG: RNA-binding protein [Bacteroidota bacterium]|nr:RNA-binding protein [Bacteroidota bacterium]MDP4205703.1 RNA-binding protein [Bacteroidota bacterium]